MIFVTGATGLLGNCVVRELLHRGIAARVLCRSSTPRTAIADLEVNVVEGDLGSRERLEAAIQDSEHVIHGAAYIHIGWRNLEVSRQVNVEGTKHIVEACLKHDKRLIYISTVDTLPAAKSIDQPIDEIARVQTDLGIPKTPCSYVTSKREAEQVGGRQSSIEV